VETAGQLLGACVVKNLSVGKSRRAVSSNCRRSDARRLRKNNRVASRPLTRGERTAHGVASGAAWLGPPPGGSIPAEPPLPSVPPSADGVASGPASAGPSTRPPGTNPTLLPPPLGGAGTGSWQSSPGGSGWGLRQRWPHAVKLATNARLPTKSTQRSRGMLRPLACSAPTRMKCRLTADPLFGSSEWHSLSQ